MSAPSQRLIDAIAACQRTMAMSGSNTIHDHIMVGASLINHGLDGLDGEARAEVCEWLGEALGLRHSAPAGALQPTETARSIN